jgi:HPt (histidine-containing phosphotransfer) domain-containing protein
MEEIRSAVEAGDATALSSAAHTIKGALGIFGAEPARSIAEELENLGRGGRVDGARELLARLGDAVVSAEEALDRFLRELQ